MKAELLLVLLFVIIRIFYTLPLEPKKINNTAFFSQIMYVQIDTFSRIWSLWNIPWHKPQWGRIFSGGNVPSESFSTNCFVWCIDWYVERVQSIFLESFSWKHLKDCHRHLINKCQALYIGIGGKGIKGSTVKLQSSVISMHLLKTQLQP